VSGVACCPCLPAWLAGWLATSLSVCLHVCAGAAECLSVCLSVCLSGGWVTWLFGFLHIKERRGEERRGEGWERCVSAVLCCVLTWLP